MLRHRRRHEFFLGEIFPPQIAHVSRTIKGRDCMRVFKWLGVEIVEVSTKEKLVSSIGSAVAIYLVFLINRQVLPTSSAQSVVASMGATAVLLFAVPHGQLSQPWPLIGGHLISSVIGVVCSMLIIDPSLATALAVGASIGMMHYLKCLHPPGGATAFTAVMGGHRLRQPIAQHRCCAKTDSWTCAFAPVVQGKSKYSDIVRSDRWDCRIGVVRSSDSSCNCQHRWHPRLAACNKAVNGSRR